MKVYFENKLGVISKVELENNNTTDKFVCKIQNNGGIEKLERLLPRVTDLTDFLLQDIDKEITLVNVIERDDSLSHINALYEEVRFKDIQNKVFAEVKEDIDILLQQKYDFLGNHGSSLTKNGTHQGVMDQIAIVKDELKEKYRQISAFLNVISSKIPTENSSCP